MNWDMVSAIGEILGSVAVLVTLIYLAIQMRQNASAIQASTRQAILQEDQNMLLYVMNDPDLPMLRFKTELTDKEKIRLGCYMIMFLRMRENNWRQHKNGVLDNATWASYRSSIRTFASPRVISWINHPRIGESFDPEFIELVREILSSAPPLSRPIWLEAWDEIEPGSEG